MDFSQLLTFALVALTLTLVPGADWAYIIASGLRDRSIIPSLTGLILGYLGLTIVLATGLGALVAAYPPLLTGLTALGAAYLLWLGIRTLRSARAAAIPLPEDLGGAGPAPAHDAAPGSQERTTTLGGDAASHGATALTAVRTTSATKPLSARSRILSGIAISGLNPKALLLYVALLPQFTDPAGAWPLPLQLGILGLTQALNCIIVYSILGVSVRALLRTRPRVARIVTYCSGTAMIIIALILATEQIFAAMVC